MCKRFYSFIYGFTHAFKKLDIDDLFKYIDSKCKER